MRSFKKCIVFAVVTMMLVLCISCGKAEDTEEAVEESAQVEETEKVEENKEDQVTEEPADEVTEEAADTEVSEEGNPDESDVTLLTGTYLSTLIGEQDLDMNDSPYIESVEIEDGYLVITGCLQGISDDIYEFDTYRFKITEETEFYSAGGSLGAISINLDEFAELAHYYNGLGMVLEIEDGVIEEGRITS